MGLPQERRNLGILEKGSHWSHFPNIQSFNFNHELFHAPFTKTSPNYPHKNNADNSIKIAFTNSELPKIIRTLFTSAHKKNNLEKMDECAGKGRPLTAPWKLSALFWNCVHNSEVWSRCGYYADNCSIEKVQITLVPFRFYDQIEFVKGVSVFNYTERQKKLITSLECHPLKSKASTWIIFGHRLGKFYP